MKRFRNPSSKSITDVSACVLAAFLAGFATVGQGADPLLGEVVSPLPPSRMTLFEDSEVFGARFNFEDNMGHFTTLAPSSADLGEPWTIQFSDHQYTGTELGWRSTFADDKLTAGDAGLFFDAKEESDPHPQSVAYAIYRGHGRVSVEIFNHGERQENYLILDGLDTDYDGTRSLDLKVADLDLYADEDGRMHDEIVVARQGGDGTYLYLDVLKVDPETGDLSIVAQDRWQWSDGDETLIPKSVSLTIGDYNGDRFPDIAVVVAGGRTWADDDANALLVVYNFKHDDENHVVTPLQLQNVANVWTSPTRPWNMDTASGDFDGDDGKDEIFIVYGSRPMAYWIYQSDENFNWTEVAADYLLGGGMNAVDSTVVTAAGNFIYKSKGDLTRQQVAVCWQWEDPENFWQTSVLECDILDPSDFNNTAPRLAYTVINPRDDGISGDARIDYFDMDVGNFRGHQVPEGEKNPSPAQQIILHSMETISTPAHLLYFNNRVYALKWEGSQNLLAILVDSILSEPPSDHWFPEIKTMVVAYDMDGDSWRLGVPTHLTIESAPFMDVVVEEPPKHVDYLPMDPLDLSGDWDIINVSSYADFNVAFDATEEDDTKSTNTSTTTHTIGAALTVSDKVVEDAEIEKASVEDTAKLSYEYESQEKRLNSHYVSTEASLELDTSRDDAIKGQMKSFNVWRYPVLNFDTGDETRPIGTWDLVIPNPIENFVKGGRSLSWYQPRHENRNILSYPQINEKKWPNPQDIGCFRYDNLPSDSDPICGILNTITTVDTDNHSTQSYEWTSEAGSANDKEYSHKLGFSNDAKISLEVGAVTFLGGASNEFSAEVDFENKNSWSGAEEQETSITHSKGISITVNENSLDSMVYAFQTAVYVDANTGAFTVKHATNPGEASNTSDAWHKYYNRLPDPALNLPNKFIRHNPEHGEYEEWYTLRLTEPEKSQMRGFYIRSNEPDSLGNENPIKASAPTEGETVKLCANVYNYSIEKWTGEFDVNFYYQLFDTSVGVAKGYKLTQDGMSKRIDLYGIQDDNGLPSMKEVCVDWDTSGLLTGTDEGYRFWVVLDEPNEVEELHELGAPGGNNEGIWPWTGGVAVVKPIVPGTSNGKGKPDLHIDEDSLCIETESDLLECQEGPGSPPVVRVGETYRLRARITSDMDYAPYHYAFFYEEDPSWDEDSKKDSASDGELINGSRVFGVNEGDSYIWTDWTPEKTGLRKLYVKLFEKEADTVKGNASDTLRVVVAGPKVKGPKVKGPKDKGPK